MSIQSSSARHRARFLERQRRNALRALRAVRRQCKRLAVRVGEPVWPRRSGAAYLDELLTPVTPGPVHIIDTGAGRIGHYTASYVAAAPRVADEVCISYYPLLERIGLTGTVVEIVHEWRPLVVVVPGVGTLTCEPDWLHLVDRPMDRTLTMLAVSADLVAGRAW